MFAWFGGCLVRQDQVDLTQAILLAIQIRLSRKKGGISRLLRRLPKTAMLLMFSPHQWVRECGRPAIFPRSLFMDPISSIGRASAVSPIDIASALSGTKQAGGVSFGKSLEDAMANVSKLQNQSQTLTREFQAENPNVTLEETMISIQQSSLSFQAVVQVRNKLVTAYNEMMNMQV
jgi:flagellar hook-basal body complex protein FliE